MGQQGGEGLPAEPVEVLAHRGERGPEELRPGDVVEADHAEVFRGPQARLLHRPHEAKRKVVGRAQHRRGALAAGPVRGEPASGPVARPRAAVLGDQGPRDRGTVFGQGMAPSGRAVARRAARQRPRQVVNGPVAQVEQVSRCVVGAVEVARAHGRDRAALRLPDHDGRDGPFGCAGRVRARGDDDEPVDPGAQALCALGEPRPPGRGEDHPVTSGAGGRLDARDDRSRAVVSADGADHADGAAAARYQGPGGGIRLVLQLPDGGHHPHASRRPHVRTAVEHPRYGLLRDARDAGDIGQDRRPPRPGLPFA